MATAASLPFAADRFFACFRRYRFVGLDLTGATLRKQVRLRPNTPALLLDLGTVTVPGAKGFRLISVVTVDGVPTSTVEEVIPKADMAALPYSGEIGEDTELAYDLSITIGARSVRRLYGPFVVLAGVIDADGAPLPGGGVSARSGHSTWEEVSLTFDDGAINVTVSGLDTFAGISTDAAAEAFAAVAPLAAEVEADRVATAAFAAQAGVQPDGTINFAERVYRKFFNSDWIDGGLIRVATGRWRQAWGVRKTDGAFSIGGLLHRRVRDDVHAWFHADSKGRKALAITYRGRTDFDPGEFAVSNIAARQGFVSASLITTADGSVAQNVGIVRDGLYRYDSALHEVRVTLVQRAGERGSVLEQAAPMKIIVREGESIDHLQANAPTIGGAVNVYDDQFLTSPFPPIMLMLDNPRAPGHPEPQSDPEGDPGSNTIAERDLGGWDHTKYTRLIALRDGYDIGTGKRPRGQGPFTAGAKFAALDDVAHGRTPSVRIAMSIAQGGMQMRHISAADLPATDAYPGVARLQYATETGDAVAFQAFWIWDRAFDPTRGMIATVREAAKRYRPTGLRYAAYVDRYEIAIASNDGNPFRPTWGGLLRDQAYDWTLQRIAAVDAALAPFQDEQVRFFVQTRGTPGATAFPNYGEVTLAQTRLARLNLDGAVNPRIHSVNPDTHVEQGASAHPSARGQDQIGEQFEIADIQSRRAQREDCMVIDEPNVTVSNVAGRTEIRLPVIGRYTGPIRFTDPAWLLELPWTEDPAGTTIDAPVYKTTTGATYKRPRGGYPYLAAIQDVYLSADDKARRPADWSRFVKGFWVYRTSTWPEVGLPFVRPVDHPIQQVRIEGATIVIRLNVQLEPVDGVWDLSIEYSLNGPGNTGVAEGQDGYTEARGAWGNICDSSAIPSVAVPGYFHRNRLHPMKVST